MGEDERCAGDVADFAGAGGDVLEGAPAAGEQDEPGFALAAQGTLDGVATATAETVWASTAWMLPPWVCALPEYHRSMTSPLTLMVGSLHRSQGMIVPSRITCENPASWARSSAWCNSGACPASTDDLVQVPVGSGPRDAMASASGVCRPVAGTAQPQHRRPKAGQRPAAAWSAAAAPLGEQELRNWLHQFPGNIERAR